MMIRVTKRHLDLSFSMLRFSFFKEKKKTIKPVGLTLRNYLGFFFFHNLYINITFKGKIIDCHARNICNMNFIVHYHAITVPYRVGIYILSP